MSLSPATLAALVVAISFAAGLNVYATILTLGGMARMHWVVLPSGLEVLASWWVIGASAVLFSAEFVADKIPGFDLVWNAAHTFIRVPVALLLAYGATTHLTPDLQMIVTILGGAIAAITHGSKLAVRGAVMASPEPFSNVALSSTEDAVAIGITWAATHHPIVAGSIAGCAVLAALLMARLALRAIKRIWAKLIERPRATAAALAVAMLAAGANSAHAQMLARPGWNGTGVAAQSWSKHAVIYEIDTRSFADSNGDGAGDLKGIAQHLDYLQALGVDAILLDSLLPPAGESAKLASPIDPALGTVDDFDDLSLQASKRNIRILLDLPQPDAGLARFWLTRGIAGFHITGDPQANPAGMQAIRKLLNTNLGQRVLIVDAPLSAKPSPNELSLDTAILKLPASSEPKGAQLRAAIEQSQTMFRAGSPILVSDASGIPRSLNRFGDGSESASEAAGLARVLGAVLLLNRSASQIYAGQELALSSPDGKGVMMPWGPPPVPAVLPPPPPKPAEPAYPGQYIPYVAPPQPPRAVAPDPASAAGQALNPGSVLNFYRQLIQLHRGNGPLRDGDEIVLNHDDQNALVWVRRPARPTYQNPAVFVVCNLSNKPLSLSLKADIARLHLRGSFLRTVLRSDDATGSMPVDPMTIPPYGVYAGELKF